MDVTEPRMRRRVRHVGVAVLVAVVAWVMSGCDGQASVTPGPTASGGSSEGASSDLTEPGALEDGEHFGFVSDFSAGVLEFEPAEFFTEAEAEVAAAEDGAGPGDGGLPNGFYIRESGESVQVPVAEDAEVEVVDWTGDSAVEPRSIDTQALAGLYSGDEDIAWVYASLRKWPVHLTVEGGVVTEITEQYLP